MAATAGARVPPCRPAGHVAQRSGEATPAAPLTQPELPARVGAPEASPGLQRGPGGAAGAPEPPTGWRTLAALAACWGLDQRDAQRHQRELLSRLAMAHPQALLEALEYGQATGQLQHLPEPLQQEARHQVASASRLLWREVEVGSAWQNHTAVALESQERDPEAVVDALGTDCLAPDSLALQHAQRAAAGGFVPVEALRAADPAFFEITTPVVLEDASQAGCRAGVGTAP